MIVSSVVMGVAMGVANYRYLTQHVLVTWINPAE